MTDSALSLITTMVNCDQYGLDKPGMAEWQKAVQTARESLAQDGCCVLTDFIPPQCQSALAAQSAAVAPNAYYTVETVNAYNTDINQLYPATHPASITFERGNAFVARDLIPPSYLIQQLYSHPLFKRFIAACFTTEEIHELSDPLAGLCVNVLEPGKTHPWHFDTNEFTVSLMTQPAESGGVFEYCPAIRSPEQENLEAVRNVITGKHPEQVKRLQLKCGDLQLFQGRYSLHRVSPVSGQHARHTVIFAYTKLPNVVGSIKRTRQLFGRVLPEHIAAQQQMTRSDFLMD